MRGDLPPSVLSALTSNQLDCFLRRPPNPEGAHDASLPVPSGILTFPHFSMLGEGRESPASVLPVRNLISRPAGSPGFFSNSDDHLLKNIELFDKLSLRFNGRVLFIKDVIGDEICCWSFYGQGRKLAEVCCTSIVYATEKKQTKVGASLCMGGAGHTPGSERGIHFAL